MVCAACGADGSRGTPAGIDPAAMDTTADPCQDFYQYACGGYLAAHPVGPSGALISRRSTAFFATEDVEKSIVDLGKASSPGDADEALLSGYHRACLGAAPGTQDRTELTHLLAQIDAIAGADDLARAVASLHEIGASALFRFDSARDLITPGALIALVGQGGIGLPDRSYYLDAPTQACTTPSVNVKDAYLDHIRELSARVGLSDPAMPGAVWQIERALGSSMLATESLRDPTMAHHLEDFTSFEALVPDFAWPSYLSAAGAPEISSLDVTVPRFFVGLEGVLQSTTLADLQRYLRFRAVEAFAGALGDDAVAEEDSFHKRMFYGFTKPLPRPEYCLRATIAALPWPLSRAYAARVWRPASEAAARELLTFVQAALKDDLTGAAWLDEPTRGAALAKLAAMQLGVGAPTEWPSYEGLALDRRSFVAAQAATRRFQRRASLAQIGAPEAASWFMAPVTVNAAYSPSRNTLNLPAGILQAPFFDAGFAPEVNFGAIGAIMGHEMTHGFDDQGRFYDGQGRLADAWTPAVLAEFNERAQCLVKQYDAIEALPGVRVNGRLTLGENIADLGGVKLALAALRASEGATASSRQVSSFFVAYAQSWCINERPASIKSGLCSDAHAPERSRVNAVLANVPDFAEAFSCHEGSAMAPVERCEVW